MAAPRIVVVGANFAGLKAAQTLGRDHEVTVVDPSPSFEWLPNIHELISAVKRPRDLRLPRRRLVRDAGHRFVQARVVGLDPQRRCLRLENREEVHYDACIVAVGGGHDNLGVPGAARFALPFKSVEQCVEIGRRLRAVASRRGEMAVAIVGAGLEGIEALGEILRRYRTRSRLRITVVDGADEILPGTPADLDATVRRDCESLPVRFALGEKVAAVRERSLRLAGGETIGFDVCIWSGGAAPAPLLGQAGLTRTPKEWAPARPTLQSIELDDVFLAGDAAALRQPLAKQAFYALQMGEHAARNAERFLRGKALTDFAAAPKPMLVTFGDLDTFLVQDGTALAGTALAAVKEAVFQLTMAQIDPPTGAAAIRALGDRLGNGLASAVPALASMERLLRLPRVRLL